jgi:HEAT repeat protein
MNMLKTAVVLAAVAVTWGAPSGWAQDQGRAKPRAEERPGAIAVNEAIELTNGWGLLAQGLPNDAAARAQRVLAAYPRSAAALVLAVEAEIARGGGGAGLAVYEQWIGARPLEEPSTVRRIAFALLHELARDQKAGAARLEAVRALAADGDESASQLLAAAVVGGKMPETRVLASMGNEAAVRALIADLEKGGSNPVTAIQALADSGSRTAVAPISARLKSPSPEVRAAAVEALGELGQRYPLADRIKPLLSDPVSLVRVKAAGALVGLGDMSGLQLLQELATSEAAVSRLIAAQAMASQPDAQWLDLVRRLTSEAEPEVRVGAATLLVPHDPEMARKVLDEALRDGNPAIRQMVEEASLELLPADLRSLRLMLRSSAALARARAAGRILALVR